MTTTAARPLTAGEVAERLGVTHSALLKAEARGDIPPAQRDFGTGDRLYSEADVRRLREHFDRE